MIVVEDENGNIVRETMKDNDVLAQYKSMRETLVYLCHLDYEDTEGQMLDKLRQQVGWEHGSMDRRVVHTHCMSPADLAAAMLGPRLAPPPKGINIYTPAD